MAEDDEARQKMLVLMRDLMECRSIYCVSPKVRPTLNFSSKKCTWGYFQGSANVYLGKGYNLQVVNTV